MSTTTSDQSGLWTEATKTGRNRYVAKGETPVVLGFEPGTKFSAATPSSANSFRDILEALRGVAISIRGVIERGQIIDFIRNEPSERPDPKAVDNLFKSATLTSEDFVAKGVPHGTFIVYKLSLNSQLLPTQIKDIISTLDDIFYKSGSSKVEYSGTGFRARSFLEALKNPFRTSLNEIHIRVERDSIAHNVMEQLRKLGESLTPQKAPILEASACK